MLASRSQPQLDVGQALREGWRAFNRAPWLFVGFALLLTALQLALQALQPSLSPEKLAPWETAMDWETMVPHLRELTITVGLFVFTSLLGVVANLWGTCSLVRAAWVALGGGRPRVATFLHWDPQALLRLYLPGFVLGCGVVLAVSVLVLLAAVLGRVNGWLALPPGLALLAGTLYLSVSQAFLPQVALLDDDHPFTALARGRRVVDPVWPRVVSLLSLNAILVLAGLCACGVGLLVAIPLVTCVSTAAYRQLFGPEDRTGLTRGFLEPGALSEPRV
ncbi:MAG: hypothetical protein FJ083_16070 [Cyanobacteria bacterium K_Offshore_surface_m2_239]|nr:hypothetical protein [Cyanobacteria bacterium K_Offshore_surface_m2_239]